MPSQPHARRTVRQLGSLRAHRPAPQRLLPFLEASTTASLPRPARRVRRAFRPHLRQRTRPGGVQLVLPLRSPPGARPYVGMEAVYMEDAVRAARRSEGAGIAALVALTRPEVLAVAHRRFRPGLSLGVEELVAVAEARLVELRAWERFTPGRERGRTLWPAYVRRLASQAMGDALTGESLVRVTRWARRSRKARLAATARVERVEYRGMDSRGRMVRRVATRPVEEELVPLVGTAVELPEHLPAEDSRLEQLQLEASAVQALSHLPVRQRVAVAGAVGLLREGALSDRALSQHLRCSPEEVARLREVGLAQLRQALEAECR
jgi:hypothetical protein